MARTVAIRLGVEGAAQVKTTFDDVANSGDASAKRWKRSYEQASDDVQAAMQRQANAAAKIAAIMPQTPVQMRIADNNSTGFGQWEGSARQSAAAFRELYAEQERLETRTRALIASINPAAAAQDRFNAEIGEARALVSAGAISLDQYVDKLRLERAALDAATNAQTRAGGAVRGHGSAMAALAPQAQDAFTQISMGTNVLSVLAIQGGQAAGQMVYLEGAAGKFGKFMMGPWGLAITGGMLVLSMLTKGIFENADGSQKAKDKALSLVDALTKEKFGTAAAMDALRDFNAEKERGRKQDELSAEASLTLARERLNEAMATRHSIKAEIDRQRAASGAMLSTNGMSANPALAAAAAALVEQDAKIAEVQKALGNLEIDAARQYAKAASDPIEGIRQQYRKLREQAEHAAASDAKLRASLGATLLAYTKQEKAAVDAQQASQRAAGRRDGETVTASAVAKMLRDALPGVHVTSTTGGKHVNGSYHYKNQAVDFVPKGGMASMDKADVRRLFESRGIDVVELLGPGDKGHSDHFHVAWTKGKLALDEFSDAARRSKDAQEDLERKEKERAATLAALVGQFDPARAAGDEYAATLTKIALVKLDPAQVEAYTAAAREAFIKARADAFVLPDVEADRPALDDATKGDKEAWEQQDRWRKAGAETLASEQERLAFAREQNRLLGRSGDEQDRLLGIFGLQLRLSKELGAEYENWAPAILLTAAATDEQNAKLKVSAAAMDELRGFGSEFVDTVLSEDTWSSWGNAGKTILNSLKSEFIKLALLNPLKNLINGDSALPTLTSAMTNIGKLFGKNAAGTEWWSGGMSLVGEHGPEIVSMPRGSRVTTAGETRRMFDAANDRGSPVFHFDLRGAVLTQDLLAQMNGIGQAAAVQGAQGGRALTQMAAAKSQRRRLPGR